MSTNAEDVALKYLLKLSCDPIEDPKEWEERKKELFRVTHHYPDAWRRVPVAARARLIIPKELRAKEDELSR